MVNDILSNARRINQDDLNAYSSIYASLNSCTASLYGNSNAMATKSLYYTDIWSGPQNTYLHLLIQNFISAIISYSQIFSLSIRIVGIHKGHGHSAYSRR